MKSKLFLSMSLFLVLAIFVETSCNNKSQQPKDNTTIDTSASPNDTMMPMEK